MTVAASARITQEAAPRTALESLSAHVADDLHEVNRLILARMHSPVGLIPQLAGTSSRPAASACARCSRSPRRGSAATRAGAT